MKKIPLLATAAALAFAVFSSAQDVEIVPLAETLKPARVLNENILKREELPLAIEPDLELPQAIKAGEAGLLVVPDRRLAPETFSAAETAVPLAQLWLRKVVLGVKGRALASEKQRRVLIEDKGEEKEVQLYLLGVAKNDAGALELIVFGKDQEPLLRAPIAAVSASGGRQRLPIELAGRKDDDETGTLTLNLLGSHLAELVVKRPEE